MPSSGRAPPAGHACGRRALSEAGGTTLSVVVASAGPLSVGAAARYALSPVGVVTEPERLWAQAFGKLSHSLAATLAQHGPTNAGRQAAAVVGCVATSTLLSICLQTQWWGTGHGLAYAQPAQLHNAARGGCGSARRAWKVHPILGESSPAT